MELARPPAPRQVLLRLPEDLAIELAKTVAPRKRNQFLVDLVAQALRRRAEKHDQLLREAAERMNELEAQYPELVQEAKEWDEAALTDSVDVWDPDFDAEVFERDLAEARAKRLALQQELPDDTP
jgi:hypothetical protein